VNRSQENEERFHKKVTIPKRAKIMVNVEASPTERGYQLDADWRKTI